MDTASLPPLLATVTPQGAVRLLTLSVLGLDESPTIATVISAPIGAHYSENLANDSHGSSYIQLLRATARPKLNYSLCGLIRLIVALKQALHSTQNQQHKLLDGQRGQGTSEVPPSEGSERRHGTRTEGRRSSVPNICCLQTAFHLQTQQFISGRKRQSG